MLINSPEIEVHGLDLHKPLRLSEKSYGFPLGKATQKMTIFYYFLDMDSEEREIV